MNASAFDRLARTLSRTASRRVALSTLLTATGATLGLAGAPHTAAQTSCTLTANGQRCSDGSECCSGRCERRRRSGPRVCRRARYQGICTIEQDVCGEDPALLSCGKTSGGFACSCFVTTTGRSFCGAGFGEAGAICGCTSNKVCEQRLGKGARCVQLGGGGCTVCGAGEDICVAPCPNPDPVP